jgi:hypothetical protein
VRCCNLLEENKIDEGEAFLNILKISIVDKTIAGYKDYIKKHLSHKLNKFMEIQKQYSTLLRSQVFIMTRIQLIMKHMHI